MQKVSVSNILAGVLVVGLWLLGMVAVLYLIF